MMIKSGYKLILFVIALSFGKPTMAQDYLVDHTYLGSRSKFELLLLFGSPVDYAVDLYKIRYKTPGIDQMPDTASGLLVVPQVPPSTMLPIVMYEHGTSASRTDVPSQLKGGYEVAMAYAAFGFITIAPDYLGLGDSRGFHPYVHAATEASASLDMLNGSLEWLDVNDPDWDANYLFVAGYSQGGHASMALHKEIDDFWSLVYPVTAATHMSGPYSISGVMRDKILSDESYGSPAYIAYIVLGYNSVYGDLYESVDQIFKEPYATRINNFHQGSINLTTLNNQLIADLAMGGDTISKRMFQDSMLTVIATEPDHPINIALDENNTHTWGPQAPTRLYYCDGDEQVPFENSLVAEAEMNALGAADLQAINVGTGLMHGICAIPAVLSSIEFFQSFLMPSSVSDPGSPLSLLEVYPNPASNEIHIAWETPNVQLDFEIFDAVGRSVSKGSTNSNTISVSDLQSGLYMIICSANHETRMARIMRL